jgi:beta-N-acetylhexosaminidase
MQQNKRTLSAALSELTVEQKIAHLIMPEDRRYSADDWKRILDEVPLGCVFLQAHDVRRIEANVRVIQDCSDYPVLAACDMESGYIGGTVFPPSMGLAATGDPEMTRRRSEIVARDCRSAGFHWCFNPVVDLALNHNNPETLTRSFGDNPESVAAHAVAQIDGMQAGGMVAATAKHFPGAGSDDRDQHLCTSANRLSVDDWWKSYGYVWRAAIEAGVYTIMPGHISFPAYQDSVAAALPYWQQGDGPLPATLSSKLQIDLLRDELGFAGVIVSDAAPMVGIASRVPADEAVVQNIVSGGDVYLFADPVRDFRRLLAAYREGRLPESLIDEKVERILALKMKVALIDAQSQDDGSAGGSTNSQKVAPKVQNRGNSEEVADTVAAAGITIQKTDPQVQFRGGSGSKVLTITVTNPDRTPAPDFSVIDDALEERGITVDHWDNPGHREIAENIDDYDHIFLNIAVSSHTWMGTSRMIGGAAMTFWRGWWFDHPGKVTVTSFGSPYHIYEIPSLPNMILAYGAAPSCQRAAVAVWLGEAEAPGRCPVTIP